MADDTPQQMINAEKRKLQKQAVDLPPATVTPVSSEMKVVQGEKGGETPQQMATKLDDRVRTNEDDLKRMASKVSAIKNMVGLEGMNEYELIRLAGEGKIQFPTPEAQAAAMDVYKDSMNTFGNASLGVESGDYDSKVKLRDLEEEFPETKPLGPQE
tara:strand:- start:36 stop:506 length:471 start_codon:yes stop_codon:yes gene_type:complete